jgi:DNA-binding NtrC family response regulator
MNDNHPSFPVYGVSSKARDLKAQVERAAASDDTVLVQGEPGTGKGLVAEAIHKSSSRATAPFVVCDLRKVEADKVEAELRDAFARARGGSLLIDEVFALDEAAQREVLALLEHRLALVGSESHPHKLVRVILATSHDLDTAVAAGAFQGELLRHVAARITIPTLRERAEDILPLAELIVKDFAAAQGRHAPKIAEDAIAALTEYGWPGNVRELAGVLQRGMSRDPKGETLTKELVHIESTKQSGVRVMASGEWQTFKEAKDALLEEWEKDYLRRVLERSKGNMTLAARQAGIARGHLYRLMKKHGLCR